MIGILLALLETAVLALGAWMGTKLFKGPAPGKDVPGAQRAAGAALLSVAMTGAFVLPLLAGHPYSLWWIPASAVAGVVLAGTRRRRAIRRGPLWFAAWMLLTVGAVELVFWLGESILQPS